MGAGAWPQGMGSGQVGKGSVPLSLSLSPRAAEGPSRAVSSAPWLLPPIQPRGVAAPALLPGTASVLPCCLWTSGPRTRSLQPRLVSLETCV